MQHLRLFRPLDLCFIGIAQYLIRFFVIKPFYNLANVPLQVHEPFFALLVVASIFIAAGGYLINDYYDLRIGGQTAKNNVCRTIGVQSLYNLSLICSGIGCVFGLVVAWKIGFFNLGLLFIVFATILYFYALRYKRLAFWGDFCIAILASVGMAIVWLFEFFALRKNPSAFADLFIQLRDINYCILIYSLFVFVLVFIRQMVKDIVFAEFEQVGPDNKMFAARLGTQKTVLIIGIITIALIISIAIGDFLIFNSYNSYFVYMTLILIEAPLVLFLFKLFKAKTQDDFQFLLAVLKIIVFIGILLSINVQHIIPR